MNREASPEKTAFDKQLKSLKVLMEIYLNISPSGRFENAAHLLRSEYVLIVSAFDSYLHRIVHRRLTAMFFSDQSVPDRLNMKVSEFQEIFHKTNPDEQRQLFEVALRKRLAQDSFQSPRSVEYVMGLIRVNQFWTRVASQMGTSPDDVRDQLAMIVHNRNMIAHESDIDPSTGELKPRTADDVDRCRDFLAKLVECVDSLIEMGQ